jgi:hypothetical protein
MSRLLERRTVSYTYLVQDMPIAQPTVMDHINAITKLGFIVPGFLEDGSVGYAMDRGLYQRCTMATRQLMGGRGSVVSLVHEVGKETG